MSGQRAGKALLLCLTCVFRNRHDLGSQRVSQSLDGGSEGPVLGDVSPWQGCCPLLTSSAHVSDVSSNTSYDETKCKGWSFWGTGSIEYDVHTELGLLHVHCQQTELKHKGETKDTHARVPPLPHPCLPEVSAPRDENREQEGVNQSAPSPQPFQSPPCSLLGLLCPLPAPPWDSCHSAPTMTP